MSDQYYNINCINCTNCTSCTNCIDCDYCERCNYAANCTSCADLVVSSDVDDGAYVFSNCNNCTNLTVEGDEVISSPIVFNNSGCSDCQADTDNTQYGGIQNCINCIYSTNLINCNNLRDSSHCYYSSNCQNITYSDHCLNAKDLTYSIYCQSLYEDYMINGNSHQAIGYVNSQEAIVYITSNYCSQEIYSVQNYASGENVIINPTIQFTSYSDIIFSGNLPANLTIDNGTGVITGEYAISESYTGNITVNFNENYTTPLVINYAADGNGNIRCSNCSDCINCYECESCRNCTACSNCTSCDNMSYSINCNSSKNGIYFDSCDNCDGNSHQYATGCKYCIITGNNTIGIIGTEEEPITTSAPDLCSDTIYNNSVVTNSNFSIIPNLAFTPNKFIRFSDNLNTINVDSATGIVSGTTSFTDVSSYIYITTSNTTLSTPIVINLGDENGNVRCSNCSDCMNCYECVDCKYCNYCSNCTNISYAYRCDGCSDNSFEGSWPEDSNVYVFSNCKNCNGNKIINIDGVYTGEPFIYNNVDCSDNTFTINDVNEPPIFINCINCSGNSTEGTFINCNSCGGCRNCYYSSNCEGINDCDHSINCENIGDFNVYLIDCKNIQVQSGPFYGLYLQNNDEETLLEFTEAGSYIGPNVYSDYTYDRHLAGWNNVNITPNMQFTSYSGLVFSATNLPATLNIDANTGSLTGTIATTYNSNVSIVYQSQTFSTPLVMNVIEADENGNIRCSNCTDCYSCYECIGCQNCRYCSNSSSCYNCYNCFSCSESMYCSNSNNCTNVKYMDNCSNCSSFVYNGVNDGDIIIKNCVSDSEITINYNLPHPEEPYLIMSNCNMMDRSIFNINDINNYTFTNVQNCDDCTNCNYCIECDNCENCYSCVACTHCIRCTSCTTCVWYADCINCSSSWPDNYYEITSYIASNCSDCLNNQFNISVPGNITEPIFVNCNNCNENTIDTSEMYGKFVNCSYCNNSINLEGCISCTDCKSIYSCNNCENCQYCYESSNCQGIAYADNCINCEGSGNETYALDCENCIFNVDGTWIYIKYDTKTNAPASGTIGQGVYNNVTLNYNEYSTITPNLKFTSNSNVLFSGTNPLTIDTNTGVLTGTAPLDSFTGAVSIDYNSLTFNTTFDVSINAPDENGNVNCVGCTNCFSCYSCINCSDCNDCVSCSGCSDCTSCWECSNCSDCNYYDNCINCNGGGHSYAVACVNCNMSADRIIYYQSTTPVTINTSYCSNKIYPQTFTSGPVNISPAFNFTSNSNILFNASGINIGLNTGVISDTISSDYNSTVTLTYASATFTTPVDIRYVIIDDYGNMNCSNCVACYSCYECVDCENCTNCTNCESCIDCISCNYCTETSNSNQCVSCTQCLASSFSWRCVNCINCPYCTNCTDCTDCFILINCTNCTNCRLCVDLTDGNNQTKVNWS